MFGLKNIWKVTVNFVFETTKLSMADKSTNLFARPNSSPKNDPVKFISILEKKMLLKCQRIFQINMNKNIVSISPDHKDIKCEMKYIVE